MNDPFRRPTLTAAVFYQNPRAALDWLESAFGFERSMLVEDPQGKVVHSEMRFREAVIYVGYEFADYVASPVNVNGKNTQVLSLLVAEGLDAHCERARAAGARILREPSDQFYGDRVYAAQDLEGHVWNFGQVVREVSREEAEKLSGLKIEGRS